MRPDRKRPSRRAMLTVLGALSCLLYGAVAFRLHLSNLTADVVAFLFVFGTLFLLYATASWLVHRRRDSLSPSPLLTILLFAVLFRVLLLLAGLPHDRPQEALRHDLGGPETGYAPFLIYDNDVWRYLWDGNLLRVGLSPYASTPSQAIELAEAGREPLATVLAEERWWDILDNISFHAYTTVYPPLAQALFALAAHLAPGSVFVLKLLLILVDLATCGLVVGLLSVCGLPRERVLLYAWNPLVVKEFAGSGHVDGLMIFWVLLALLLLIRGRQLLALTAFALSVLSKVGSLVLLVLFLRHTRPRLWLVLPGLLVLGFLPFAGDISTMAQGFAVFSREWVFNSGPWVALRALLARVGVGDGVWAAHAATKTLLAVGVVGLPWLGGRRPLDLVQVAFLLLAGAVLLNPAVMPWYLLWALPLATVLDARPWFALTGLSLLSYLTYVQGGVGDWWLWVEYGVFATLVFWELHRRRLIAARQEPLPSGG